MSHIKLHGVKPRIQYISDGTLTTYEFPFVIFSDADVQVYLNDTLQETGTYIVSGVRNTKGGCVVFITPPAQNTVITIMRNLTIERTTDFQEGGTLRSNILNDEFDYQTACLQQIADNLNRSMVLPPYAADTDVNLTLPTPSAGKAIVWNKDGTNLENSTVKVNELESTLSRYKEIAQTASSEAISAAQTAIQQADVATQQADIATQKAEEAVSTVDNKVNIDFSNVTQENAHKLVGNRIWISGEYDLSHTANVIVSHDLGLTDVTKALAIPYLKFTTAIAGYQVGEIISNFALLGMFYSPGDSLSGSCDYGPFLNLSTNTVMIPKLTTDIGLIIYNKSTGVITQINKTNVKVFVKIMY